MVSADFGVVLDAIEREHPGAVTRAGKPVKDPWRYFVSQTPWGKSVIMWLRKNIWNRVRYFIRHDERSVPYNSPWDQNGKLWSDI